MAMLFPQICIIASFLISVLALPFHDESGRMAQADYGLDEYIRRYYLSSAERSGAVGLAGYMVGTTWVYMQVYDAILEKQNPNHRYRKCISKRFGTDLPGWYKIKMSDWLDQQKRCKKYRVENTPTGLSVIGVSDDGKVIDLQAGTQGDAFTDAKVIPSQHKDNIKKPDMFGEKRANKLNRLPSGLINAAKDGIGNAVGVIGTAAAALGVAGAVGQTLEPHL